MSARALPPPNPPYTVYCISSGRPGNVPAMQNAFAPDPLTWVVPREERHEYAALGAAVLPVPPPAPGHHQLTTQRQAALTHARARGAVCVQTDDDLRHFNRVIPKLDEDGICRAASREPAAWPEVRDALLALLDGQTHLAGLTATDSPYYALRSNAHRGFIPACLTATDTDTPGWDTTLPLKEDYDLVCAHLGAYGRVGRLTGYIAVYSRYNNRGGVVTRRTPALEAEATARLLERWPRFLLPHHARPNELSFRRQAKGNP